MILTLIAQSIVIVAFWLLGRNLGIEAGLRYYFVVFPVGWVVGAIPISLAGLGVTEAGTVGLFTLLTGAPSAKVMALASVPEVRLGPGLIARRAGSPARSPPARAGDFY